ncbi:MAG: Crp/Fnr family transcriptional regulator [Candidatus Manganitrophus sp.]|nr:Crp/Fnr family transcriptional regulator [Candidatus Manganitrophus sp.]WDT70680.1 MAG: Crp/Fnr family transcriptional regulator [Candidatus Manganitrophus sp.]WDT77063.1 MAG: Crp/Fnr family transcriptional regulator [Candidatus Manganitrophus sp.]
MTDDRQLVLRHVPFFQDLSAEELAKLAPLLREASYRKNEVLFRTNDPGNTLFILRSGRVKVTLTDRHGREVILRVLQPGEIFGEMAVLDGYPRSATVTALEKSYASTLDRDSFLRFIQSHPQWSLKMLATMSRRLRKANERISSAILSDAHGKVSRVLLDLIPEGEWEGKREGIRVRLALTRQQLAAMAGVTRETFIRVLKEFERAGSIRTEGKEIIILKQADLSREIF